MPKPGDDVDSWCGVCKMILAHTIEAVVDDVPARVHCNTCNAQHRYRPNKPGTRSRSSGSGAGAGGARRVKTGAGGYDKLLEGRDTSKAKRYSPSERYAEGDLLDHAKFGVGVTTIVKLDAKIEVVFKEGMKTLIHDR